MCTHQFKQHGYTQTPRKSPNHIKLGLRIGESCLSFHPNSMSIGFRNQVMRSFSWIIIPSLLLLFCLIGSSQAAGEKSSGDVCNTVSDPGGCPINCFRADPVCGADGVTYWCGCPDAACHGARVVKTGACDAGNAGSASVPGQALLLIHIVWLFLLGLSLLVGAF